MARRATLKLMAGAVPSFQGTVALKVWAACVPENLQTSPTCVQ